MLLTDLKEIESKTIKKVEKSYPDDNCCTLTLHFTDGSLISLETGHAYDMTDIIVQDEVSEIDQ